MDWYFNALDEGLKHLVPHIFQIPRGKASSSSSPVVLNRSCPAEVPVPEPLILNAVGSHYNLLGLCRLTVS